MTGYSPTYIGMFGASGSSYGVLGQSTSNIGVYGASADGRGVYASSTNDIALFAVSTNSDGIYATAFATGKAAIKGQAQGNDAAGLFNGTVIVNGTQTNTSTTTNGMIGYTSAGNCAGLYGVAQSASSYGVVGKASSTAGLGGLFYGGVTMTGALTVYGTKSAAVPHPDGSHRLVYCMESPDNWFEDFGTAKLAAGKADIALDGDFAAIVKIEDYHVFLTEYEDNSGLFVTGRTAKGVTVRAKGNAAASGSFSYRIVAKRKDIDVPRLAKTALPVQPKLLPPTTPDAPFAAISLPKAPVFPPAPAVPQLPPDPAAFKLIEAPVSPASVAAPSASAKATTPPSVAPTATTKG